jgi:hypothetical protein
LGADTLCAGLRHIRSEPFTRCEKLTLVNDVVPVEDRASFVARKEHRYTFGHASADQIPRRRPPTIVQQSVRHLRFSTRVTQRGSPLPHGDAIAAKHSRISLVTPPQTPLLSSINGKRAAESHRSHSGSESKIAKSRGSRRSLIET